MKQRTDHKNNIWPADPTQRLAMKNAFDASLVYGTAGFHQKTGRTSRSCQKPFAQYINPADGLIAPQYAAPRPCPLCRATETETLFIKDGFPHGRCAECGLIYVPIILNQEILEDFWRQESSWQGVLNSGPQLELDRLKFLYGLKAAEAALGGNPQNGRLMDIGAGNGLFVRLAAAEGWQTTALELNQAAVAALRADGFSVIDTTLDKAGPSPGLYDLITLWEVLEHLDDPLGVLKLAGQYLKPGGRLLVMVPNAESLVTRLLHEKSGTFGGHSHLNHFGPASLRRLLGLAGFEISFMETAITEMDAINNYLGFHDPYSGPGQPVLPQLTPGFIHDNLLGSRLLTVARAAGPEAPECQHLSRHKYIG